MKISATLTNFQISTFGRHLSGLERYSREALDYISGLERVQKEIYLYT